MSREVSGVPIAVFEDYIHMALREYTRVSDGRVTFDDHEHAANLELTPDKPNSARSSIAVRHLGEVAGTLYVIAFAPGDGTGDESAFKLADIDTGSRPHETKVVPRSKATTHSEVHLTIASKEIELPNEHPKLHGGGLEVLGLEETEGALKLVRVAEVGESQFSLNTRVEAIASGRRSRFANIQPRASLTVGYYGANSNNGVGGERFADPHAVYNPSETTVQVCGFIAIAPEMAPKHLEVLGLLGAKEPYFNPYEEGRS